LDRNNDFSTGSKTNSFSAFPRNIQHRRNRRLTCSSRMIPSASRPGQAAHPVDPLSVSMTSSALNLARRTAVPVVGIFAFSVFTATHGFGQALSDTARTWSWSRVRAIEGVDERKVDWLAEHAPNGEDVQLLELVDSLSDPGAAQLLVGRFLQD